jgi:hypothetical protein
MKITKLEYVAKTAFFMNQNQFVKLLNRGFNREAIAGWRLYLMELWDPLKTTKIQMKNKPTIWNSKIII